MSSVICYQSTSCTRTTSRRPFPSSVHSPSRPSLGCRLADNSNLSCDVPFVTFTSFRKDISQQKCPQCGHSCCAVTQLIAIRSDHHLLHHRHCSNHNNIMATTSGTVTPVTVAVSSTFGNQKITRDHRNTHCGLRMVKLAREKFTQEISLKSKDGDISLAKALLFVAAEDEALIDYSRHLDACSLVDEMRAVDHRHETSSDYGSLEEIPLAGKSISHWLHELDTITKEVEAELVHRDIGCHLVEVLEAVNIVLFESRCFKRFPVLVDSKFAYLHNALSYGRGTDIILSIIYIEVCRRLGVTIVGSRFGENFLIWPQTENVEELFRAPSGDSFFATVNGKCVKDPRSKASDLDSTALSALEIATNRDIIGIALANLIRLHWRSASRINRGLLLTSPLRNIGFAELPLIRPLELRLAIMAVERLLILQPLNWALRRDHGMLLYYSRRYGEAIQELSICMAFAPVEDAEILEAFVEKLHLLRLESSWKSLGQAGSMAVS